MSEEIITPQLTKRPTTHSQMIIRQITFSEAELNYTEMKKTSPQQTLQTNKVLFHSFQNIYQIRFLSLVGYIFVEISYRKNEGKNGLLPESSPNKICEKRSVISDKKSKVIITNKLSELHYDE